MDDANTTDGGYDVNQTWLNVTGDGHVSVQHPYEARIVEIVFTGVVTTLIILSNGVVLVAIATNSAFRDIRFLFIGNLAAIDLITGVTMAYNFVSIFVAEALSYYACLTVFVLVEFSLRMSSLSMLLVTANQYLLIVHPLRYPALMNAAVARRLLAAAWIVCAVIYSLPYAGWNGGGGTGECLLLLVFSDSFMFVWDVALFVVPAAIMVALYAEIFIVARRHCRQIAAQEVTVQSRDTHIYIYCRQLREVL
ncbi:PREDICTED: adenosine receptor A2b-like [Priapulus caudatus]|uniref:Adenosine receptor A2b-like n=1 Tax=Priapulus caudatus TaxID=37621 RepID=A0ABM1EHP1_PRICU|nr:PREDICTED: adenosine receptor A2b-like [Priapulus caudatus]